MNTRFATDNDTIFFSEFLRVALSQFHSEKTVAATDLGSFITI